MCQQDDSAPSGTQRNHTMSVVTARGGNSGGTQQPASSSTALTYQRAANAIPRPQWHAPWQLSAVVSGHLGWVRSIAFDPSNEWFVTGAADRTIKVLTYLHAIVFPYGRHIMFHFQSTLPLSLISLVFQYITTLLLLGQIWDLAKCCAGAEGGLKLTLTGHINAIRGLAVSPRHPYLFSAAEDKMVKCEYICCLQFE